MTPLTHHTIVQLAGPIERSRWANHIECGSWYLAVRVVPFLRHVGGEPNDAVT